MDKKVAALLGAVAGIATIGAAQASPEPASPPTSPVKSYAELLAPIANPVDQLRADDAAREQAPAKLAQYYPYPYYYHHHHDISTSRKTTFHSGSELRARSQSSSVCSTTLRCSIPA